MLKGFSKGGVHPPGFKISRAEAIVELPPPTVAVIPLSQHIGAPAVPCVAKGDRVVTGQLIAAADGFVSANVHSSVSGTVTAVGEVPDAAESAGRLLRSPSKETSGSTSSTEANL